MEAQTALSLNPAFLERLFQYFKTIGQMKRAQAAAKLLKRELTPQDINEALKNCIKNKQLEEALETIISFLDGPAKTKQLEELMVISVEAGRLDVARKIAAVLPESLKIQTLTILDAK